MTQSLDNNTHLNALERDLLEAADAMLTHVKQEKFFKSFTYSVPDTVNVKEIRHSMHLTQQEFAQFTGASVHAIRHWENGRRKPDGTARTLLCVLKHNPHFVREALEKYHSY